MGQSGERSAYVAAVQTYLHSEAGQGTPRPIAERMLALEPGWTGAGECSQPALHILRLGLEDIARKDARPRRIFLALTSN